MGESVTLRRLGSLCCTAGDGRSVQQRADERDDPLVVAAHQAAGHHPGGVWGLPQGVCGEQGLNTQCAHCFPCLNPAMAPNEPTPTLPSHRELAFAPPLRLMSSNQSCFTLFSHYRAHLRQLCVTCPPRLRHTRQIPTLNSRAYRRSRKACAARQKHAVAAYLPAR